MLDLLFSTPVTLLVALALVFDFLNGFHDSANVVATMIASRSMSPRKALILNAVGNLIGPFLFGVAVAKTIGQDVVSETAATQPVIIAALGGAIVWNLITWLFGLPSSSSHALIGGLIGSALTGYGLDAILVSGLIKVLIALFLSPFFGILAGYLLMNLAILLTREAHPRINYVFKRVQVVTATALALSHGTNDAQKTMGIITMGLVAEGVLEDFVVPLWVVVICAGVIALGTALGGWRIIRTLGAKFYKVRPMDSFISQVASAAVIFGAAFLGGPVSTTHVVSTSIVGVGSADRVSKVRWGIVGDIITSWLLTIPASGLLAAMIYLFIVYILV